MGVYSNYIVTESGIYSPSAMNAGGSALDLMIECAQDDMKMFDSVIELDFMHAYSEAGMVSLTEADDEKAEKSIGKKIKDLFEKIKKKIKDFIATFIAKLQNLMHNDINLYKEYSKDFANANGVKVDGFRDMRSISNVISVYRSEAAKFNQTFNGILNSVESAKDSNAISKVIDDMNENKTLKKLADSMKVDKIFFISDKNEDDYTLRPDDVKIINEIMANGGKKIVDVIRNLGKEIDKGIDSVKKNCKAEKYMAGYLTDANADLMIEKANAKYKVCNKYASTISKFTSAACNMSARYVAMARKIFIAGSRKAASKSTAKGESAVDNNTYACILGEASDIYVESALRMV